MPKSSGVYELVNTLNGHRYVGSAVNLDGRWSGHRSRLTLGKHHNGYLQAAWAKYGAESFAFRPLLICAKRDVVFYEQRAFDVLQPEYNLAPTAGNTLGFKFSAESRAKIAAKAVGRKRSRESVEQGAAKLRGRKIADVSHLIGNKHAEGLRHTDEWKTANSLLHSGSKRPKSPEYREKIAAALRGIPHSLERRARQAAGQLGKKRGPYKKGAGHAS